MCGIVGITSNKSVTSMIINSLKKLEYRGYDSSGIATLYNGNINEVKCEGRVDTLEKNLNKSKLLGNVGIGHVRWATHGMPSTLNAHPHSSENVSVVHNGIIENSTVLKKILVKKGHVFKSQTDTEVITHLITEYLKINDLKNSIIKILEDLKGSFALGIIFKDQPDIIVGARRGSPLAVGYGPKENYLGSDSYALKSMTNKVSYLNDGEFCIIKKDNIDFFDQKGNKVNKKILELSSNENNYDKGEYKHFMAKEIDEQPVTIKNCINEYIVKINNDMNWKKKNLDLISKSYSKSKFFDLYNTSINSIFEEKWEYLIELNIKILKTIFEWLDVKTKIIFESELNVKGTSSEKLLNICKEVKATKYVSGPGGKNYLDEKIFQKNHIDIEYQKYTPISYSQLNSKSFIPNLSILDLLFNMGYESRKFVL